MARVLLVEDEPVLADLLREVLGQGGHEVAVVHEVGDALKELQGWSPEFVVSDFLLPDRTGLDLARALPEIAPNPPPMMLITAYLEPDLQAEVEAEPVVVQVLRKPLDVFAFREVLEGHLSTWRAARPTPVRGEGPEPPEGPAAMGVASI